jgi:DNA-binding HxlR family transcriptional regulator
MKRTSFAKDECPVARSLEVVGDWWSLLIIRNGLMGQKRFGEFQKALGVAKNILTVRLKKLVAEGVMDRVPASDGSAYEEYVLTEKGRRLLPVIVTLGAWGCEEAHARLIDRKKGKRVRLELRSEDGRKLGWDDVQLVPGETAAESR